MSSVGLVLAMSIVCAMGAAMPSHATSTANMIATSSSTATVTIRIDITSTLGSSNDTDTRTVSVTGPCSMALSPNLPPWATSDLTQLNLVLGNAVYSFDFFCIPFLGCQHMDLALSNLRITLAAPVGSPVATNGTVFYNDGQYLVHTDYSFTGFSTGSGSSDTVNPSDFSGRLVATGQSLKMDQCAMSPQMVSIPPDSLPSGVSAVTLTITTNLANTIFQGPWAPDTHPADLNGDGTIGGLDLTALFAAWGTAEADINGDGTSNGLDMTEILSAWTP